MITALQLAHIMPAAGSRLADFAQPLTDAAKEWGIDTPLRLCMFLAQGAHECAELTAMRENLNYSAPALLRTWPKRFDAKTAAWYARKPQQIANRVYANRLGNGDEASNDGWMYRGGGFFMITGRTNFRLCSVAIASDADTLLIAPWLVEAPAYAAQSAGWYWASRNLNRVADTCDVDACTTKINGGAHGKEQRREYYRRAREAFGV